METRISLSRQSEISTDVDLQGFRIQNLTNNNSDISRVISLYELDTVVNLIQTQITTVSDILTEFDDTDGLSKGAIPSSQKGSIDGVVPLGLDGKIDPQFIPNISIRDVFVVNNDIDKLSLIAQKGDVVLIESTKQSYILVDNIPGVEESWVKFRTLADIYPLQSVQSQVGDIVLTAEDVGAISSSHPKDTFFYTPENVISPTSQVSSSYDIISQKDNISLTSIAVSTPKNIDFVEVSGICTRYTLSRIDVTYPTYWKLIGSVDGISWVLLDERINSQSFWGSQISLSFQIQNPKEYPYIRLQIFVAGNNEANSTSLNLSSIKLETNISNTVEENTSSDSLSGFYKFENIKLDPTNDIQSIGKSLAVNTESIFLNGQLLSQEEYEIISGSNISTVEKLEYPYSLSDISAIDPTSVSDPTKYSIIPDLIPVFNETTYSVSGFTISVSNQLTTGMTRKLIDKVSTTQASYWDSGSIFLGTGNTGYCTFLFSYDQPKYLLNYSITPTSTTTYSPKSWKFEGSNDASVWDLLHQTTLATAITTTQTYDLIEHTLEYKYYRITFLSGFSAQIRLLEVDLFNKLFSRSNISSSILDANLSLWYQTHKGYSSYTLPDGFNNAGMAFGSGLWKGIFRWNNQTEILPYIYSISQWSNTSVSAPKSWKLYAADSDYTPALPMFLSSANQTVSYDNSFFDTIENVPDSTIISKTLSELTNDSIFNTQSYSNISYNRVQGSNGRVLSENSVVAVGTGDIFVSCYVTFTDNPSGAEIYSTATASIFGIRLLVNTSSKFTAIMGNGSTTRTITDTLTLEEGKTYHTIFMRKNGVFYFIRDGILVGSDSNASGYDLTGTAISLFTNYYTATGTSKNGFNIHGLTVTRTTPSSIPSYTKILYSNTIHTTSSSNYSATYASWKSFTSLDTEYWIPSTTLPLPAWLMVENFEPFIVRSYYIRTNVNSPTSTAPKSWRFEGSNDGSTWSLLDEKNGEIEWSAPEERHFKIETPSSFKFYRLFITSTNGATYTTCRLKLDNTDWELISNVTSEDSWQINEVRYYTTQISKPRRFFQLCIDGKGSFGFYMLIKNFTLFDKVQEFGKVSNVPPKNKIVVSGLSNLNSAYNLFDDQTTNYWSGSYPSGSIFLPLYINLDSSTFVDHIKIKSPNSSIIWVEVFGSNDGLIYTPISKYKQSYNLVVDGTVGCMISLENSVEYSRFLLKIYGVSSTDIRISEIQFNDLIVASQAGIKLNVEDIHQNDKVLMRFIGK